MIGNSPRSDVNPALAAGLNAIFIPHDFTWVLEHEVVNHPPPGQTLLELRRLRRPRRPLLIFLLLNFSSSFVIPHPPREPSSRPQRRDPRISLLHLPLFVLLPSLHQSPGAPSMTGFTVTGGNVRHQRAKTLPLPLPVLPHSPPQKTEANYNPPMPDDIQRDPRVYFAAERNLLAWIRTGLAILASGFAVSRFGLYLRELASVETLSSPVPPESSSGGRSRPCSPRRIHQHLRRHRPPPHHPSTRRRNTGSTGRPSREGIALALLLAILGIATLIYRILVHLRNPHPTTPPRPQSLLYLTIRIAHRPTRVTNAGKIARGGEIGRRTSLRC